MARTRSAGDLFYHIAFDQRVEIDDGAGNTVGEWQEQFQCRAGYIHLVGRASGGEAVIADRLQGQHTQIVFIRRSAEARLVTTDWRVHDLRSGTKYNIRDITVTEDRMYIDFLCQSGVADG